MLIFLADCSRCSTNNLYSIDGRQSIFNALKYQYTIFYITYDPFGFSKHVYLFLGS